MSCYGPGFEPRYNFSQDGYSTLTIVFWSDFCTLSRISTNPTRRRVIRRLSVTKDPCLKRWYGREYQDSILTSFPVSHLSKGRIEICQLGQDGRLVVPRMSRRVHIH